jgi:hypothetical protein
VTKHAVQVPYPDRQEPTIAQCICGWHTIYGWGGQADAEQDAVEHVRQHSESGAATTTRRAAKNPGRLDPPEDDDTPDTNR